MFFIRGADVPPTLTSISPTTGAAYDFVTATGVGFQDGAVVYADGIACTNVTFVDSTELTFNLPNLPDGGPYEILIVNPDRLHCRLYSAFTVSVSPLDYSPKVYSRADDGVANPSAITQWDDLSGNGLHSTGSGGSKPALVASNASYNNHPTINFASSKLLANAAWGSTITGDVTFFFIGNCGAADGFHCAMDGAPINEVTDVEAVALANPANAGVNLSDVAAEFPYGGIAPSEQLTSPSIVIITYNASTFTSKMYVNSLTPVKTTVGSDPSPLVLKTKAHTIGALSDAAYWGMSAFWDGDIAEFGIYEGVIDSTKIAGLMGYGSNRYNITLKKFAIYPASIGGIVPKNGDDVGLEPLTIKGWGFTADGGVVSGTLGGVALTSLIVVDDNTITCVTPAHAAGSVDLVLTNANGHTATRTAEYEYLLSPYTLGFDTWHLADKGVTLVSGKVQKIADISSVTDTNKDLTDAGSSSKRPAYAAADSDFNNRAAMNFNSTTAVLVSGTLASALTSPQTILVVGKRTASNSDAGYYVSGNLDAPRLYKLGADASLYILDTSAGNLGAHTTFIAIIVINGASSFHMKNTTTKTTLNLGAGHTISSITAGLNTAGIATGKIAEIAIKQGALSEANCQALMTSRGKRNNVTIS